MIPRTDRPTASLAGSSNVAVNRTYTGLAASEQAKAVILMAYHQLIALISGFWLKTAPRFCMKTTFTLSSIILLP
jgi:hypothetical protein